GYIENTVYRIGQIEFVQSICQKEIQAPTQDGKWIVLADEHQELAWFRCQETLRTDAKEVISHCDTLGLDCHMLSGDPSDEALLVAKSLNISNVEHNFSFEQKNEYLCDLQRQKHFVAVVGDGINDALMLQNADIGIAMNVATDFTKTNADAILVNNSLIAIPHAISTMRFTQKIIKQNIFWAVGYNVIALPLALTGWIPPYLAALGMSLSSLIVVFNALRIKRLK